MSDDFDQDSGLTDAIQNIAKSVSDAGGYQRWVRGLEDDFTRWVIGLVRAVAGKLDGAADAVNKPYITAEISKEMAAAAKGRAVSYKKVHLAMHLMTARIAIEVLPDVHAKMISKAQSTAEGWLFNVANIALKNFPLWQDFLFLVQKFQTIASTAAAQAKIEAGIRAIGEDFRKQLVAAPLSQTHGPRKVTDVSTRHNYAKKRRQKRYKSQ